MSVFSFCTFFVLVHFLFSLKKSEIWSKYGQWCYRFQFRERIRLHWLFHSGIGEIRFLSDVIYNQFHPLTSIWHKLWEDSICGWPLTQTGLVFAWYQNFLTYWMVCSVYYLGCMVVNVNALFAGWGITERDYFQILLLGILSSMELTTYFQI